MVTRRWAVLDADGLVDNVVLWDGTTEWSPPDGFSVLELASDSAIGPGDTIDKDGKVTVRVEPEPVQDPAAKLDAVVRLLVERGVLDAAQLEAANITVDGRAVDVKPGG